MQKHISVVELFVQMKSVIIMQLVRCSLLQLLSQGFRNREEGSV
jgi:hypothetical protein